MSLKYILNTLFITVLFCSIGIGQDKLYEYTWGDFKGSVFEIENGYMVVEAEQLYYSDNWQLKDSVVIRHYDSLLAKVNNDFTGSGFLVYKGKYQGLGHDVDTAQKFLGKKKHWLVIKCWVPEGGNYRLNVRCYNKGNGKNNAVWIGTLGQRGPVLRTGCSFKKQFGWSNWGSTVVNLQPGMNGIVLCGRSKGFGLDRIAVYKKNKESIAINEAAPVADTINGQSLAGGIKLSRSAVLPEQKLKIKGIKSQSRVIPGEYFWKIKNNKTRKGKNLNYSFEQPGIYQGTMIVKNKNKVSSEPVNFKVKVHDPDAFAFSIPQSEKDIKIDGHAEQEWTKKGKNYQIENLLKGKVKDQEDLNAEWKTLWDKKHLYLFTEVKDDTIIADSEALWEDDAIEILIDGDGSLFKNYDGINDVSINIRVKDSISQMYRIRKSSPEYEYAIKETSAGYRVEIAIPWQTLNITEVKKGHFVGLDVHVNEDDKEKLPAQAKISTFAVKDIAWKNPSVLGLFQLK